MGGLKGGVFGSYVGVIVVGLGVSSDVRVGPLYIWSLSGFIWFAIRGVVPNTGCAWAGTRMFVGGLHTLISWL